MKLKGTANLGGMVTRIGDWQLIKFTVVPGQGVKIDLDKRCRECGDTPFPGALAWINMNQPYIYCNACFQKYIAVN